MSIYRNYFYLIGPSLIVATLYFVIYFNDAYRQLTSFDEDTYFVYSEIASKLVQTGSAAEATTWGIKVDPGLSADDVEETMKAVAYELNIKTVGELPLYQQINAMTGKKSRYMKIFMFCNPLTAAKMVAFNPAFSAYLPCRISLIENQLGELWIYALNMDLMIHGGSPLPEDLKAEAIKVKSIIQEIMARGATGDF